MASPDSTAIREVLTQRGFSSAAAAYNDALARCHGEVAILLHQDVYLPPGWLHQFQSQLAALENRDPDWGVVGLYGVDRGGQHRGHVYCTGQMSQLGGNFNAPIEVASLDELLLVVRPASGLRFDESIRGYHMYGTDICLEAIRRGKKAYVLDAPCLHNTNPYQILPWDFWRAYLQMRRKWWRELPVHTTCTSITRLCLPMLRDNLIRRLNRLLRRPMSMGGRVDRPGEFWKARGVPRI